MVLAEGDSITAGVGVSPSSSWYPNQAVASFGVAPTLTNNAITGSGIANVQGRLTGDLATLNAWTGTKVYSVMIGINDLKNGADPNTEYASLMGMCQSIVVQSGVPMIIFTVLPSNFLTVPQEANRITYNGLIRAGNPACGYSVADVASDGTIGQPGDQNNVTYYQDGTHPTAAGDTIIGVTYMRPQLTSLGFK